MSFHISYVLCILLELKHNGDTKKTVAAGLDIYSVLNARMDRLLFQHLSGDSVQVSSAGAAETATPGLVVLHYFDSLELLKTLAGDVTAASSVARRSRTSVLRACK